MIKFCSPIIPDMKIVEHYLQPSFAAGVLSNFGPAYRLLCERLHKYLNLNQDKEIVIVSSGHTALMAAYYIFNCNNLLIQDYTFRSTLVASSISPNARQTIEDVDSHGFLNPKTKKQYDSISLVCSLSRIPDFSQYSILSELNKVPLIIDGAATFGTPGIYNEGDAFCLSFHATKTFSVGECGAVICSKENAKKIKQYINFGFDENRNPVMEGMNAKVSEYTCAIGLAILDQIEGSADPVAKRLMWAEKYNQELGQYTLKSNSDKTVYQTFPIYMENSEQAENVRKLLKDNQIEFLKYYRPLTGMKNAEDLYSRNISLPCHQDLSEKDVDTIIDIIKKGA